MLPSGRTRQPRLRLPILGGAALAVLGLTASLALGQSGDTGPIVDPETGAMPTIAALFMYSPIINGINGALSVFALLLFLYFLAAINSRSMAPGDFITEMNKLVQAKRYEQAVDLCRQNRGLLVASISQRAVENANRDQSVILEMIDAEGRRRADVVWNRISYLADIANVAPMLGLLGTVMGMIKAFFLLPSQSGSINSIVLSQGIGEAMSTTMFGLIVAILSLMFYSVIKSRATRALAEVEQTVHNVADEIKRSTDGDDHSSQRAAGTLIGGRTQ